MEQKSGLNPTVKKFLTAINSQKGPPIYKLSVEAARKVLLDAQSGPIEKPSADIENHHIPGGPNGQVSIRIIRPQGEKGTLPVVMYFHGGGWVLGNKETHDRLVREIANRANAAVVFVNFTPSPEAKYPTAIEEAYAAVKYISENDKKFNLNSSKLAVAGDSVGGNMAAAITLLAIERGGPDIVFQALFYPVTDADFETPSYQQFAEGYFLTREAMKWFWNNYLPDQSRRKEPTASPLRASIAQLKKVPPALVITGELDVLRDEGEAYAHKLMEAGVSVTAIRYLGITHDFLMLNALSKTEAARNAMTLACGMLQKILNNGSSDD